MKVLSLLLRNHVKSSVPLIVMLASMTFLSLLLRNHVKSNVPLIVMLASMKVLSLLLRNLCELLCCGVDVPPQ